MKRLSKAQEKTKQELVERLHKVASDVAVAADKVNAEIDATLNPAIERYNEVLAEMGAFPR